jgi:hypothetical protein
VNDIPLVGPGKIEGKLLAERGAAAARLEQSGENVTT